MRCCWPQQEERREQCVNDSDAVDHVAVFAQLERPVRNMFTSPAFENAKDDRSDLDRRAG
jgi:hypothetical protein